LHLISRIAGAYVLSLAAAGALQQALMLLPAAHCLDQAFIPLAVLLLPITAIIGVAFIWRPTATVLGWTTVIVLAVMLALGVAVYVLATASVTPGVGGNAGVAPSGPLGC